MGAIWVNAGYQKRETLRVELKSDLKRLPDPKLIDTVMALSNTEGGELTLASRMTELPQGSTRHTQTLRSSTPATRG